MISRSDEMYKIMVITHGSMAVALKETLKMFTNDADDIYAVGLYDSGVANFTQSVEAEVEKCYEADKELLVLVDIFGGTPFNISILKIKNKYDGVEIITGVNLPLLIEANLLKTNNLQDVVKSLQESTRESIMMPESTNSAEGDE